MFHSIPKNHIKIIAKTVDDEKISYDALYLYGSFSNNEGACIKIKEDYHPYNDYDILLISKKLSDKNILEKIENILKDKLNLKWVDISQITNKQAISLKSSIKNFDIVHGAQLLKGDEFFHNNKISISSNNIGYKDIDILFETRLFTLLSTIEMCITSRKELLADDVRFFNYQLSKAILAIIDATLVKEGIFTIGYKNKCNLFLKTQAPSKKLKCYIEWALEQKLRPNNICLENKSILDMYIDTRDLFFECFLGLYEELYDQKIDSTDKLIRLIKKDLRYKLKTIYRNLRYGDNYGSKRIYLLIIQIKLSLYINYQSNQDDNLIEIQEILSEFFGMQTKLEVKSIISQVMNLRMTI